MNEILNLLNKYDSPKTIYSRGTHRWQFFGITNVFVRDGEDGLKWLAPAQLISKEYGFIKRLVENDKIDRKRKMIKQVWTGGTLDLMNFDRIQDIEYYSIEETLLMLLSISDTPIDDLISYLK